MGTTFRDNAGRLWDLRLSIAAVKRVRNELQVDLLGKDFAKVVDQVFGDLVTLCNVAYVVVKPEADRLGVTDEQFGVAMAGDAIEEAIYALMDAMRDFTPNPRDRARVGKVLELARKGIEASRTKADQALERGIEEVNRRLMDGEPSTRPPESPESTRTT